MDVEVFLINGQSHLHHDVLEANVEALLPNVLQVKCDGEVWCYNMSEVRYYQIKNIEEEKFETVDPLPEYDQQKPRAIYQSYSSHDCETWYKCSVCGEVFGGWSIYHQAENENGVKEYCPRCKTELEGLK